MDVKNFFVCTVILEFVKELTSTIPIHEVMNIWKYIAVQAWMFFRLYFRNCKSYLYNCDDLPSYNPNTDSCLPQTWIVLAFPKVSPGFSGFDEYTQDVPRSIAWSGAHWLWFSLHDMIGGSYICVSRAWFSVICQIKRTIMRLGKYIWCCVKRAFFLFGGKGGGCRVSLFSKRIIDSFIYWVLWIYNLSLKGVSRSLVIFLRAFYCFS